MAALKRATAGDCSNAIKLSCGVIASRPERGALSAKAETAGFSRFVIPAQAGIQALAPGFRVSRCSPGMTGCHEWPVRIEDFVSEQRSEAILVLLEIAASLALLAMTNVP
jgi:hypothetical protein